MERKRMIQMTRGKGCILSALGSAKSLARKQIVGDDYLMATIVTSCM